MFELNDCEFRLANVEVRGAKGDPGLGVARILFDGPLEELDTPGRNAQIGKRATGEAQHFRAVAIECTNGVRPLLYTNYYE